MYYSNLCHCFYLKSEGGKKRLDSVETGDKDVFFQIGFFILNYIMLGSYMLHYQPFLWKETVHNLEEMFLTDVTVYDT